MRYLIGLSVVSALYLAGSMSASANQDATLIKAKIEQAYRDFQRRDLQAAQSIYMPGTTLVVYDMFPSASTDPTGFNQLTRESSDAPGPNAFEGRETGFDMLYKKVEQQLKSTVGAINYELWDVDAVVDHNHAYSRYICEVSGTLTSGKSFSFLTRVTDVWRKTPKGWFVIMEHSSAPPK
jgi:ketosteroid isomerase-like protein